MSKYLVSYDLRKDRDYSDLYRLLKSYSGSRHVLESVWLLESGKSSKEVADEILTKMDSDDGIIVANYSSYAYRGLLDQ